MTQIVAIVLVKNEDIYIEQSIRNIVNFCDRILLMDNYSVDKTWPILNKLAQEFKHIKLSRIEHISESHKPLEALAGTDTWVFGVDGDEIYDPAGLVSLRQKVLAGEFNEHFILFGNVLNCINVDTIKGTAKGHLAPPCRSMTKLYNFNMLTSWTECPERLHGGKQVFKPNFHAKLRYIYHDEHNWEESEYRCLHLVFVKRSSMQNTLTAKTRLSATDIQDYQSIRNWLYRVAKYIRSSLQILFHLDSKYQKYHRGPQVTKDITTFFPNAK